MPTRFRDMDSNNFGNLNASKNKNLVRYNATSGKFETITIDTLLSLSTDVPASIVQVIEEKIDPNKLTLERIDGGAF